MPFGIAGVFPPAGLSPTLTKFRETAFLIVRKRHSRQTGNRAIESNSGGQALRSEKTFGQALREASRDTISR
jgi:hypothetical protein